MWYFFFQYPGHLIVKYRRSVLNAWTTERWFNETPPSREVKPDAEWTFDRSFRWRREVLKTTRGQEEVPEPWEWDGPSTNHIEIITNSCPSLSILGAGSVAKRTSLVVFIRFIEIPCTSEVVRNFWWGLIILHNCYVREKISFIFNEFLGTF